MFRAEGSAPIWLLCSGCVYDCAGLYSIHVLDTRSQDRLSGGPFTYTVTPGQPVAWRSGAKFGKSLSKEGIVLAGAPLEVTVAVKDTHGNISPGEACRPVVFTMRPSLATGCHSVHARGD